MGNYEMKNKLYMAVTADDLPEVTSILENHPWLLNAPISDDMNTTALTRAVYMNNLKIVNYLTETGVDVNATGNNGISPFMWAASKGHIECSFTLLKASANLQMKGPHSMNAIDFAVLYGRYQTAWILKHSGACPSLNALQYDQVRAELGLTPIDYPGILVSLDCEIPPSVTPSFVVNDSQVEFQVKDTDDNWKYWINKVFKPASKTEPVSLKESKFDGKENNLSSIPNMCKK